LTRSSLLILPRSELSTPFVEVEEFRALTYDGERFWGLKARCLLRQIVTRVRVRAVGPCRLPEIQDAVTDEGVVEYVFQELPGRRLEDRVLDAVRVAQIAAEREDVSLDQVEFFACGEDGDDELSIAAQILRLDATE